MGILEDILKALDRIPGWKRLQEVPAEVDELKSKVAALEEKLGGKWPADVCRFCGARAARFEWAQPGHDKGFQNQDWKCAACDETDRRLVKIT